VLGGHASALAVTRALGRAGVPIVNVRHEQQGYASASRYVTRQILAPDPMLHPGQYVEALQTLSEQYTGALLVPAYDDALLTVAQHHETLSGTSWSAAWSGS
jgi:predicted ATP-grasp superfamily ATP-dependent carboligase